MDTAEKRVFVRKFFREMEDIIQYEIDTQKIPPEWDGIELRAYIARAFNSEKYAMLPGRNRAFHNYCRTSNLKY